VIALFLVVSILVVFLLLNVSGSIIVLMRSFQILSLVFVVLSSSLFCLASSFRCMGLEA
jgi:hypothetical protein